MDDTAPSAGEARRRTSEAVAGLLAGSGLLVEERRGELVISNPRDPGRGWVHVEYADGYVSWERLTWTYWGTLDRARLARRPSTAGDGAGAGHAKPSRK